MRQYQVQLCETFPSIPGSLWHPCLWRSPFPRHCRGSLMAFTEESFSSWCRAVADPWLQQRWGTSGGKPSTCSGFIPTCGWSGRDVRSQSRSRWSRVSCDCQLALCWEMSLIPVIVCLFHGTLKWELSSGWPHKQLSHKHFSSASPKKA